MLQTGINYTMKISWMKTCNTERDSANDGRANENDMIKLMQADYQVLRHWYIATLLWLREVMFGSRTVWLVAIFPFLACGCWVIGKWVPAHCICEDNESSKGFLCCLSNLRERATSISFGYTVLYSHLATWHCVQLVKVEFPLNVLEMGSINHLLSG